MGVQYHHTDTNLIITGAIDDLWLSNDGRHIVVDYKSTAKNGEVSAPLGNWIVPAPLLR